MLLSGQSTLGSSFDVYTCQQKTFYCALLPILGFKFLIRKAVCILLLADVSDCC